MARRFKAVMSTPDRNVQVKYISRKLMIGANAFRLNKKNTNEVYIIDPAMTVNTVTKRLGIPFRYTTCYYKKNVPVPVNMHEVDGGKAKTTQAALDEAKNNPDANVTVIYPIDMQFTNAKYKGISSEELGTLFNPQFYRMIAKANQNNKQDQLWYMGIGNLLVGAFIAYYMTQSLPDKIIEGVAHLFKATTGA